MITFAARIKAAKDHEDRVLTELRRRGWLAEPFGQGQLPEQIRDHLRAFRTPVRWMPDIIACKTFSTGLKAVRYVDAKAGDKWKETGNHDIETAALEGAEQWEQYAGHPVYYVFGDGQVADPERIRACARQGQFNHRGSGTPFVLFSRELCVPFDTVFGEVP